jgi:hypothetical protein
MVCSSAKRAIHFGDSNTCVFCSDIFHCESFYQVCSGPRFDNSVLQYRYADPIAFRESLSRMERHSSYEMANIRVSDGLGFAAFMMSFIVVCRIKIWGGHYRIDIHKRV